MASPAFLWARASKLDSLCTARSSVFQTFSCLLAKFCACASQERCTWCETGPQPSFLDSQIYLCFSKYENPVAVGLPRFILRQAASHRYKHTPTRPRARPHQMTWALVQVDEAEVKGFEVWPCSCQTWREYRTDRHVTVRCMVHTEIVGCLSPRLELLRHHARTFGRTALLQQSLNE